MKKLVFLLFILTGCGYSPINNTKIVTITDINSDYDRGCYYYVKGTNGERLNSKGYFFDECGKFTVGDTIYIIKRAK